MIEKTNIKIESKDTKGLICKLWLDVDGWYKYEYNSRGKVIYFESSTGYWYKKEYNSECNVIYYENNNGIIQDGRKK